MEFIKKTELFFIQLQYCITIDSEPILIGKKGMYTLMLKPDIFFKLINDFNIDYPFIPENKIIELKSLMSKENINTKDALKIIENYKKQYWFLDTVVMLEPVTDKLKRTLKSNDSSISEKETNIELYNYQKHLQAKRENIYINLINEIQGLPPQQKKTNFNFSELMKTNEYIPLYGLLYNFEYLTAIDGKRITVNEMFDNYPDFELTDIYIDQLNMFDLFSLQKVLKDDFFTETTVIPYIREMFDNYRTSGGEPLNWLNRTFESVNMNPQNYKVEIRTIIEKSLIEWINIYNKIENITPQQSETKTDKLKAPVLGLFCSLINKIGIDKKDETESATVYCERICGNFKLPYTDRVRQNYNVNENKKLIKELTEKVLPLIDNETKILVKKYLDNKQPPKQNLYA